MKKLNEKGLSIVELLVCFVIVAVVAITLLNTLMEYKTEEEIENIKNHVESYKNTVTRVIQSDITDYALIAYDNKKLTVEDGKYTFTVTLKFQKTFQDGSNEKTLKIFASDKENYILYPDVVEQNGSYIKQDVKYELEANGTVLDIDTENENSTQKKEYNDLRFAYLNEDSIRVKNGNTISIDIPITHSELGDEYHIKIVAPLGLLNSPPPTEAENCTLIYTGGGCNPSIITRNFGEKWGTHCTISKAGFKLQSWNTGDSCGGKSINENDVCSNKTATVYAYACWKANKVKIQYNMNGGIWEGSTNSKITYDSDEYALLNNKRVFSEYNYGYKGIDLADYNNPKWINISKRGYKAAPGNEWSLYPDGSKSTFSQLGKVVSANSLCNAESNDCTATLYVNWKPNTYTVTLNPNGGTYSNTKSTTNKTVTYDATTNNSVGKPTRAGYTFTGWYTATSGGTKVFDENGNYKMGDYWTPSGGWYGTKNVTLYAHWSAHYVNVKFNMNGGSWAGSSDSTISHSNSFITRNGDTIVAKYEYGKENINLPNYNYSGYINISKTNYSAIETHEWNTKSDGTGTSFNQERKNYSAKELCDASKSDCTVTLYVNWRKNKVKVKYHMNGGSLAKAHSNDISYSGKYITYKNSDIVSNFDYDKKNINLPNYNFSDFINISKTGYTATERNEWNTKSDGTGTSFNQDEYIKDASELCDASKSDCIVTLYVNWRKNKVMVKYHMNGGSLATDHSDNISYSGQYITYKNDEIVSKYDYDEENINLPNYNYWGFINITRTGYSAITKKEWYKAGDTTSTYDQERKNYKAKELCDATNSDCTIILKVNWKQEESIPSGMCDTAPIGADYFGNTPLVTAKEAPSKNVGKSVDTSSWGKWCYYSWTDGPYIKSVGYDRICYTEKCGRFKGWTATQVNAETKKILGNESCRFHRAWCFR